MHAATALQCGMEWPRTLSRQSSRQITKSADSIFCSESLFFASTCPRAANRNSRGACLALRQAHLPTHATSTACPVAMKSALSVKYARSQQQRHAHRGVCHISEISRATRYHARTAMSVSRICAQRVRFSEVNAPTGGCSDLFPLAMMRSSCTAAAVPRTRRRKLHQNRARPVGTHLALTNERKCVHACTCALADDAEGPAQPCSFG